MATLDRYPLRLQFDIERRLPTDLIASLSFWRGNDIKVDAAVYFKSVPLELSNIASLTLQIKLQQNPTAGALAETTVEAADIDTSISDAAWLAGTEQHASFVFSSAQTNLDLGGGSSRQFWLVLSGLTNEGNTVTYGATPVNVYEDNAGDDSEPPTPTDEYYTRAEVDALLALRALIVAPPAASNSTGTAGRFAYDSSYLYMCVATNTWARVPLSDW
jgi:hypothetical protein